MKLKFTVDDYPHYVITPRDLTNLVLGILRYDLPSRIGPSTSPKELVEIVTYQAKRIFCDKLVGDDSCRRFDNILRSTLQSDWSINADFENSVFVSFGFTSTSTDQNSNLMKIFGRTLGCLPLDDFKTMMEKALISFGNCLVSSFCLILIILL